ncbi:MAG: ABC transporter substrate-binding protein [Sphingomonadales bacterium]
MRLLLRISFLWLLLSQFFACQNKKPGTLPAGVQWKQPDYSRLFLLGTHGKDSFIAFKNPADTSQWLQVVCWGKDVEYEGCIGLKKRNRIACMTAVFSGMMEALGTETRICCTDNVQYHTGPKCRKWFTKGNIPEAVKGVSLDREKLLKSTPDLVITYFIDNKGKEDWNAIAQQGVPVLFLQNYLENHPLARAEWLKVIGWLTGKPAEAESYFNMVQEHYLTLVNEISASSNDEPSVFCNAPYSGNWDVPSGGSYMAALFRDAGANYFWKNEEGAGKISLDIEKVYQKAKDADYWINPGACRSIECITAMDRRLGGFTATRTGGIYNATKTLNKDGGNAWWDYAVVRPDLALRDLVNIFHPGLLAEEQEFVFFEAVK